MGNKCFSSCLPQPEGSNKRLGNFNLLSTRSSDFSFLVEDTDGEQKNTRSFLSRLFKRQKEQNKKPVLELVDGLTNPQLTYSRLSESQQLSSISSCSASKDIQLQCLDARALLGQTNTSTPENSLDLEWEHETLPTSTIHESTASSWTALPDDFTHIQTYNSRPHNSSSVGPQNSDSDWSRVSSANSLEWDSVQNSIQSDIDTDTQFLLSEIERLTNKTLQETGIELYS